MRSLYKTTIVIWSEHNPENAVELSELARDAETGDSYCSRFRCSKIEDPAADPDWDGTEFFDDPDEITGMGEG